MQTAHKVVGIAEHVEDFLSHAGHDVHVHDDVNRVRQLDADLGKGRAHSAHGEGNDVHRASLHRAVIDAV